MPADLDVVGDLHLIVDLGPLADDGVAVGAAVDRGVGADLDVVLDDDAADLRHLQMAARAGREAEPVLPDGDARMDDDAVADQRVLDDGVGADEAIAPDRYRLADDGAGRDDCAAADLGARADNRPGLHAHPVLQPRIGMHSAAAPLPSRRNPIGRSAAG